MRSSERPRFGALDDVRVVMVGMSIAAPFAAEMMAECGADVVWVEHPRNPDIMRTSQWMLAIQDRRNMRTLALDPTVPAGREVLLRLLADADILIESSRGGTWAKWGLDDDALLAHNPSLTVVHVSGFGQSGDPAYVSRPSWDAVGQAFGGYVHANGDPDRPMLAKDFVCDYMTALNACWSALAGLHKARATGEGEAIDVAQFEVLVRALGNEPVKYLTTGATNGRTGVADAMIAAYQPIRCGDGEYVVPSFNGVTAMRGGLPLLGLEWGSPLFPVTLPFVEQGTPGAEIFFEKLQDWCAARTASEVERELTAAGVSCAPCLDLPAMVAHPHYQARHVFMEWEDDEHGPVGGVGFVPKFTRHPQQLWRSSPRYAADTYDVLAELGYSDADAAGLVASGVVAAPAP